MGVGWWAGGEEMGWCGGGGGINISSEKHARISRSQVNSGPYTFCTAKPVICRLKGQCHEKSCSAEALV